MTETQTLFVIGMQGYSAVRTMKNLTDAACGTDLSLADAIQISRYDRASDLRRLRNAK